MESDLCYRRGEHYRCLGCTCTCHPRNSRRRIPEGDNPTNGLPEPAEEAA